MKFHKSDFLKMGIAVAVTALVFFIFFYKSAHPVPLTGGRMSWNDAEALIAEYRRAPIMIESLGSAGDTVRTPLQGFQMDAGEIDEIINYNRNGLNGNGLADHLMIYFGATRDSTGLSKLQLIAVGVKDGVLMKNADGRESRKSSVFDKADPCPPNCPTIR